VTVVRDVLVDQVGRQLVDLINAHGPIAEGVAGDTGVLTAERRDVVVDGKPIDIGLVGEVVHVDPTVLEHMIGQRIVPVISTVALGTDGTLYNVNADTAAAAVAVALEASKFVVLTDVPGLYRNWPDTSSLIHTIAVDELQELLPKLESGMVPKMEACIAAVRGGLPQATVVDGRVPHCVLLEVFTTEGVGTMVTPVGGVQ
jgi:acetylglutamate kinase